MLLKLLGCVVVMAASAFLGYILSRDCYSRPQELRELQGMLQMFENEISYLSNLLADAFGKISESSRSPVAGIFRETVRNLKNGDRMSASLAWESAVRSVIKETSLNREDETVLISFGRILGSSDLEGQLKNIRLTLNQLKLQEKKAEESKERNEVMYKRLGVLAGAAIVIVLL